MHWASSDQAWVKADAKDLFVQGDPGVTTRLSPRARAVEAMLLPRVPAPALGHGWSQAWPHAGICSLFDELLAPGGKLWRYIPIRRYVLLSCRFSFSLSRLLQQGTFYDNRIFYSVGNLFLLLLLLPPPDVLICSLRGHSNYRAIHLHPHHFRQIL